MALPNAALIFVKRNIQRPMQAVLNSPMSPNERGEAFHLRGQAADKVTHLFGLLPLLGGFTTDTHDTLGVRPVATDGERRRHGGVGALLLAPMILVARLQLRARHVRVSLPQLE